jgi:hypothetical protein
MNQIPLQYGLLEGEIVAYCPPNAELPFPTYIVRVTLPDGNETVVTNAIASGGMFGGQYDYCQVAYRPTAASGKQAKYEDGSKAAQTVGDRVLVGFISGNLRRPIIVCSIPHPMMTSDLPEKKTQEPQVSFQIQGMKFEVNPKGELTITHQGKPQVKPGGTDPGFKSDNIVIFNMTDTGWSITDSQKQSIVDDREKKTLTISSNKEKIVLDRSKKQIELDTSGKLMITTSKDCVMDIGGSAKITCSNNCEIKATKVSVDGGGGKLTLSGNTVALGTSTGELVDLVLSVFQEILNNAPHIGDSFVSPVILSPAIATKLTEVVAKMSAIKGSV